MIHPEMKEKVAAVRRLLNAGQALTAIRKSVPEADYEAAWAELRCHRPEKAEELIAKTTENQQ